MQSSTGKTSSAIHDERDDVVVDENDEYKDWLNNLSEQIVTIWSTQLGRGPRGSDAHDDVHAWLSLSRTIRHLAVSSMMTLNQASSTKDSHSMMVTNDLEMALSRCVVRRALDGAYWKKSDGPIDDWVSTALRRTTDSWVVPSCDTGLDDQQEQTMQNHGGKTLRDDSWQALAFVSVALSELSEDNFPEDDPAKCLAVVEIASVCFYIGLRQVHAKVLLRCQLDQKEERKDLEGGYKFGNDPGTGTTRPDSNHRWEKVAMGIFLEQVEVSCHKVSLLTRRLGMSNACFPRASLVLECIRGFARLQKTPFVEAKAGPPRQVKLDSFLSREGSNTVVANNN